MYYKPENTQTFADHSAIRAAHENVIFPDVIDDEMLAYSGIYPVAPTESGAAQGQIAEQGEPAFVDGRWVQTWTVRDATPEELAAAIPQSIPMLNAHLMMIAEGWMQPVRDYIASIPDPVERAKAETYIDKALTMRRNHPLVQAIPAALGKTEAEVDALFIAAAKLEVD